MKYILREITPLEKTSLFYTEYYPDNQMDFPLHFHEDFELCMTLNVRGKRITGNLVEDFTEKDLVITGPNVLHCYKRAEGFDGVECDGIGVCVSKDLHHSAIFNTEQLQPIKDLLDRSNPGIRFSEEVTDKVKDRLFELNNTTGIKAVTLLFEIMYELSISADQKVLLSTHSATDPTPVIQHSRRINRIIQFVETNYKNKITLEDIGMLIGMSPSSVSRFFKKRTQHKFWDYLNNYRVDMAAQMMVKTEHSISEICYECGFNNISNFNRVFREKIGATPSEYRKKYKASMIPKE